MHRGNFNHAGASLLALVLAACRQAQGRRPGAATAGSSLKTVLEKDA